MMSHTPRPHGLPWDNSPGRPYAWETLQKVAMTHYRSRSARLVSLKLRLELKAGPIAPRSVQSAHGSDCTYAEEYERIYAALRASGAVDAWNSEDAALRRLFGRRVTVLRLSDGNSALFVEHESGPEVIFLLTFLAAIAPALKEIFGFLREALKAINDRAKERKATSPPDTSDIAAPRICIEVRMVIEHKHSFSLESVHADILAHRQIPIQSEAEIDSLMLESEKSLETQLPLIFSDDAVSTKPSIPIKPS